MNRPLKFGLDRRAFAHDLGRRMRSNVNKAPELSPADGTGTYTPRFATVFDGPLMPCC